MNDWKRVTSCSSSHSTIFIFVLHTLHHLHTHFISYFPLQSAPSLTAGVSVLSQDITIEAAGVNAQFLGHDVAEASRVQVGPAADDTVLWQAAQLPGHVGQNIHCMNTETTTVTINTLQEPQMDTDLESHLGFLFC